MQKHQSMRCIQGCKYLWKLPLYNSCEQDEIMNLAASCSLAHSFVEILYNRGFRTREDIMRYIFISRDQVYDPRLLKDGERAVERIRQAIANGEKILIVGDYDVDGITATSLMIYSLKLLGAQINFFLPVRARDGYGLSVAVVEKAKKNKYGLIITVDNGVTAFDAIAHAHASGIDVIVTDHHQMQGAVTGAYAIVNPAQSDCTYPFKHLAGVGVSFKLMQLLYTQQGKELPVKVYELLMLGTVADVVPLVGENRFWVREGLAHVRANPSLALEVLLRNVNFDKPTITSSDVGFIIAPQINALGRLDDPRSGVSFLIGTGSEDIANTGKILGELNEKRKKIERDIIAQVHEHVQQHATSIADRYIVIAYAENWPAGVVGLAASRIVSCYGRPTILLHKTTDGFLKGSARSIPECNIFEALQSHSDILCSFGGHAHAAGLSLRFDNVEEFEKRMNQYLAERLTAADLVPKLSLDAEVLLQDIGDSLFNTLCYGEPYGAQNPEPLFLLQNVMLIEPPKLLKDVHVSCRVSGSDGNVRSIMFFSRPDIYTFLAGLSAGELFNCAVTIREHYFRATRTIELYGMDVSRSL